MGEGPRGFPARSYFLKDSILLYCTLKGGPERIAEATGSLPQNINVAIKSAASSAKDKKDPAGRGIGRVFRLSEELQPHDNTRRAATSPAIIASPKSGLLRGFGDAYIT
jgi:hypothetical protein